MRGWWSDQTFGHEVKEPDWDAVFDRKAEVGATRVDVLQSAVAEQQRRRAEFERLKAERGVVSSRHRA